MNDDELPKAPIQGDDADFFEAIADGRIDGDVEIVDEDGNPVEHHPEILSDRPRVKFPLRLFKPPKEEK